MCAYELEKYSEAETILLENNLSENVFDVEEFTKEFGDQASFVLMLLGKIAAKTERKWRAIEAWKKALKLNPFLWSCFEELCKIGDQPSPQNIFQINNMENMMCHGNSINNVENIIITNNTPNNDSSETFLTTPPQILGSFNTSNLFNKPLFTPEESPLAQPLCLSGFWPLSTAKYKSLKPRRESNFAVSFDKHSKLLFPDQYKKLKLHHIFGLIWYLISLM